MYLLLCSSLNTSVRLYYLKDDILMTIAECRAKGVNAVGGGGSVEDDRFVCWLREKILDLTPLCVWE